MELKAKKESLVQLGKFFDNSIKQYYGTRIEMPSHMLNQLKDELVEQIDLVKHENGWFTPDSVIQSLKSWIIALEEEKVDRWLLQYDFKDTKRQKVGVIMAGNLPLVGLHDALCVVLTENELCAKLSSKDQLLMTIVLNVMKEISKEWSDQILIVDRMNEIDMLIATGSDNSARYFEYYFRGKKKLIRKNRTSIAILNGKETKKDLDHLASDVFTHFGLGCRNVTKLYLPVDFDLDRLFNSFFHYKEVGNHNKYANNYDYNKAVYLLNQIKLVENGFILLKEDEGLQSPVGVLFYEYYKELEYVEETIKKNREKLQCIVSHEKINGAIQFGSAQSPELWEYADNVDTIQFLLN